MRIFVISLLFALLGSFCIATDQDASYYGVFKNSKLNLPIEKEFIVNLKPENPDNISTGGYAKFNATLLFDDKVAQKELDVKMDIVRSIVIDIVSGFSSLELQNSSGRAKLATNITASVNAILTDSKITGVAFGNFVVQP